MPHVIVKLWPGKTEPQKKSLVEAIVRDVTSVLDCGDESVSVAVEEIESGEWRERVYLPDIKDRWDTLYKKPGYEM